jgi:hypothetical protein
MNQSCAARLSETENARQISIKHHTSSAQRTHNTLTLITHTRALESTTKLYQLAIQLCTQCDHQHAHSTRRARTRLNALRTSLVTRSEHNSSLAA